MRRKQFILLCIALMYLFVVGCSNNEELPDKPIRPTITLQKKNIEYIGGESCWFVTKREGICSDPPHPDYFYKIIKEKAVVADSGGVIRIKFPIKPDEFYLNVTNTDGDWESIGKPDQYSYNLPSKPGYYRYILSAVWEERNSAAYYFGIQIDD